MTEDQIKALRENGVYIADEVNPDLIAESAVIYPGSRIYGAETSIGPGCKIGAEAPVAIENCQLARGVALKGGYFSGAVFFDGANMGSGAHVRAGTILEEEASGAHTVGLKQTILLPFVTLGSLINFCDILMAGGTSRKDHSEVGSSYIHFNYTPHQDKATASLVGDVPEGIFLKQKPIFLGGQGGLVGPSRIAYGSVIAAGGICRQDVLKGHTLLIPDPPEPGERDYETGVYRNVERIVENCLIYIGNVAALREWYLHVRSRFIRDAFDKAVLEGGIRNLDLVLNERIKRLGDLAGKMDYSISFLAENGGKPEEINAQKKFASDWDTIRASMDDLKFYPAAFFSDNLSVNHPYIETIQSLSGEQLKIGQAWMQTIVDDYKNIWSLI
jgi:UDP-N-acetylglucosamine/UDP-N-acetylgalactosamine diphosphorylase